MASNPSWSISLTNLADLKKQFDKMNDQSKTAVKKTVTDFKTRAPAWVSAAVAEKYGISKKDVKSTMKGTRRAEGVINLGGIEVENIALVYSGRVLTPTHFKMKPTAPTAKRRDITAEIIKGSRVSLAPGRAFLADNRGGGYIPFMRTGDDRYPIKSIKTLSVPQMITNEEVAEKIAENISAGLQKRLEHHVQQQLKK